MQENILWRFFFLFLIHGLVAIYIRKLKRATNTAPWADGIEYRDIIKLDPEGRLQEKQYEAVLRFGSSHGMEVSKDHSNLEKGWSGGFQQLLAHIHPLHALQGLLGHHRVSTMHGSQQQLMAVNRTQRLSAWHPRNSGALHASGNCLYGKPSTPEKISSSAGTTSP
jgi:hypothetical protein